jgi:hypothetical protein
MQPKYFSSLNFSCNQLFQASTFRVINLKVHLLCLGLVHCTQRHRGLGRALNAAAAGLLGPAEESDRPLEGFFSDPREQEGRRQTTGATGDDEGRPALVF